METESFTSDNNPKIKKKLKKSKSNSSTRNLESIEKFSSISGKKNFLLAFDLKQINHFNIITYRLIWFLPPALSHGLPLPMDVDVVHAL